MIILLYINYDTLVIYIHLLQWLVKLAYFNVLRQTTVLVQEKILDIVMIMTNGTFSPCTVMFIKPFHQPSSCTVLCSPTVHLTIALVCAVPNSVITTKGDTASFRHNKTLKSLIINPSCIKVSVWRTKWITLVAEW